MICVERNQQLWEFYQCKYRGFYASVQTICVKEAAIVFELFK